MKATLRHSYLCRTANMSWRTCVVVKQIQSNQSKADEWFCPLIEVRSENCWHQIIPSLFVNVPHMKSFGNKAFGEQHPQPLDQSTISHSLDNIGQSSIFRPVWQIKFDRWPQKIIGHLFCAMSSPVHYFKAISDFKLQLQSGNAHSLQNWQFFFSYDLETWSRCLTLTNNRAPLLWFFKLCASFDSHRWIQTWVTVWKLWVKIGYFCPVWPWNLRMTLNNNRALLLWYFKLCASFHNNRWIETWVTDQKRPIWLKIRNF